VRRRESVVYSKCPGIDQREVALLEGGPDERGRYVALYSSFPHGPACQPRRGTNGAGLHRSVVIQVDYLVQLLRTRRDLNALHWPIGTLGYDDGHWGDVSSLVGLAKSAAIITSSFFSSEVRDRVRGGGVDVHQLYSESTLAGMPTLLNTSCSEDT
jgi:hypothetical protein